VLGHDLFFENESRDRLDDEYQLPPPQLELLQTLAAKAPNTKIVLVLVNGMAIGIPWAKQHVPAIIEGLRGGEAAGTALAEVIFGKVNPSGRMPYTVVPSVAQLPPYEDMDLTNGRTYRYYGSTNQTAAVRPLWLFGDGLSYTSFSYSTLNLSSTTITQCDSVTVTVVVTNVGQVSGDEVSQLYVTSPSKLMPNQRQGNPQQQPDVDPSQTNFDAKRPVWQLAGATRIPGLAPGSSKSISFQLNARSLSVVYDGGRRFVEHGEVILWVGGSSPAGLAADGVQTSKLTIMGPFPLELNKCPSTARNIV
jgi:beta-glucosidase